jgi:hypothetical protein
MRSPGAVVDEDEAGRGLAQRFAVPSGTAIIVRQDQTFSVIKHRLYHSRWCHRRSRYHGYAVSLRTPMGPGWCGVHQRYHRVYGRSRDPARIDLDVLTTNSISTIRFFDANYRVAVRGFLWIF